MAAVINVGKSIHRGQRLQLSGFSIGPIAFTFCCRQPMHQEQSENQRSCCDIHKFWNDEKFRAAKDVGKLSSDEPVLTAKKEPEINVLNDVATSINSHNGQQHPRRSEQTRI